MRTNRDERGQAVVFVLILLALVGAGLWWLKRGKIDDERGAFQFAHEVATRAAFQSDVHYLQSHLGNEAQLRYPPSFTDRLLERLQSLGKPFGDVTVTGKVEFESYFFDSKGRFRAQINYPGMPAYLDLNVAREHGYWKVTFVNLIWYPANEAGRE